VPVHFSQYRGVEFLTFREVWDGLPIAGRKYVWRNGLRELQPYALRESSEPPYVPQVDLVPADWLRFPHWWFESNEESAESLYSLSRLKTHDGPDGPLDLYFDRETVEAFKKAGRWSLEDGIKVELPRVLGTTPAKGGRPAADWQESMGAARTVEEALKATRAQLTQVQTGDRVVPTVVFPNGYTVTLKHFKKVLHGRLNPKSE